MDAIALVVLVLSFGTVWTMIVVSLDRTARNA
jgi:hypothetical protein